MNTFANGLYLFNFRWQNCSLFGGNLQARTQQRYAKETSDKASTQLRYARDADEKAASNLQWAYDAARHK